MTVSTIKTLSEIVEIKPAQDEISSSSLSEWICDEWRKILAEFLSTLLLVLLGCMSCIPVEGFESALYSALGFGMVVMFNIQIFGHVSGAFMNPAVTLTSMIWGATSVPLGIVYMIVQCGGAIIGYGILDVITYMDLQEQGVCVTKILTGQSAIQGLGVEIAISTALMLINCAMWDPANKHKQDSASIKFGLTIVGLSLVGGPLTGASMNPARSLGPAVWTGYWTNQWIYWVGPFIASVFATIMYKLLFLYVPKN